MNTLIKQVLFRRCSLPYQECKRYAGHSKWANIKHTKALKDGQRASALMNVVRKMKIAIAEGKSSNPEDNLKLARIIEAAKDASLPMTTVKNALEKMQASNSKAQSVVVETRGPSGSVVLIHLLTDNVALSRQQINTLLRKSRFTPNEIVKEGTFLKKGIIVAEVDGRDMDKVTDDAIDVDAEEVEKLQEDDQEFLQFACNESDIYKVHKKLQELNYKIIKSEVEFIPQQCVSLSDEEMEVVSTLAEKLQGRDDVAKLYTNIS